MIQTDSVNSTLSVASRVIKTDLVNWREFRFIQADNFKDFDPSAAHKLKASILSNQFTQPFYVWEDPDGLIYCLDGKHRTLMLEQLIAEGHQVPYLLPGTFIRCDSKKEAAKLVTIYSSIYARVSQQGLFDFIKEYELEMSELKEQMELPDFDMLSLLKMMNPDSSPNDSKSKVGALLERFIIPPFSVFDARQGYWQERKRVWLDFGIKPELGRNKNLTFSITSQGPAIYDLKNSMRDVLGYDPTWDEVLSEAKHQGLHTMDGTSLFDPVLAEIVYRWFNIPSGKILDPFAGGSVRGIVASALDYPYTGIDIRKEQIEENFMNAKELKIENVNWIHGDSKDLDLLVAPDYKADFLFSCPPYGDLEKYSDLDGDISNLKYPEFIKVYNEIILKSCKRLNDNRFACFVVSEIRDKNGIYQSFVPDTIRAFEKAGLKYYNDIVLINSVGSLAIRVGKQMRYRKVGRMHQNVLVFFKGNPKTIKELYPELKLSEEEV